MKKAVVLFTVFAMLLGVMGIGGCGDEVVDKEDKVLRVALSDVLGHDVLDPILTTSVAVHKIVGPVFESLVGLDEDGTPAPQLATSWEPNEDASVWTIYLRKGVQFHDGWGEMTANDVKFSIERFGSDDSISTKSGYVRDYVKEIVILDDYELEIHLTASLPEFVIGTLIDGSSSEGIVMSKAYWEEVADEGFMNHPIGTGRWKFVEHRIGDGVVFETFDEHWSGELPGFDRLEMMQIPEEGTRVAMLERGEVDLIDVSVDRAQRLSDNYELLIAEGTLLCALWFMGSWQEEAVAANMPTTHRDVREALSLAINREEIVNFMFGGMFDPVPFPGLYTPKKGEGIDTKRWIEWAKEAYRYDPERAIELLEQAGFPDGFEVEVFAYTVGRGPWQIDLWEAIAGYWAEIGVKANLNTVDFMGYYRPARDSDPVAEELLGSISMHSFGNYVDPISRTATGYAPPPHSRFKFFSPDEEELVELMHMVRTEIDFEKRVDYYNELLLMIGESYINPSLFYGSTMFAISNNVAEGVPIRGVDIVALWAHTLKPEK